MTDFENTLKGIIDNNIASEEEIKDALSYYGEDIDTLDLIIFKNTGCHSYEEWLSTHKPEELFTESSTSTEDKIVEDIKEGLRKFAENRYSSGYTSIEGEEITRDSLIQDFLDYTNVSVNKDDEGNLRVWVGAEVGYNTLIKISDALDPIIRKYDDDAYFDAEDAGLLVAYVRKEYLKEDVEQENSLSTKFFNAVHEVLSHTDFNEDDYWDFEPWNDKSDDTLLCQYPDDNVNHGGNTRLIKCSRDGNTLNIIAQVIPTNEAGNEVEIKDANYNKGVVDCTTTIKEGEDEAIKVAAQKYVNAFMDMYNHFTNDFEEPVQVLDVEHPENIVKIVSDDIPQAEKYFVGFNKNFKKHQSPNQLKQMCEYLKIDWSRINELAKDKSPMDIYKLIYQLARAVKFTSKKEQFKGFLPDSEWNSAMVDSLKDSLNSEETDLYKLIEIYFNTLTENVEDDFDFLDDDYLALADDDTYYLTNPDGIEEDLEYYIASDLSSPINVEVSEVSLKDKGSEVEVSVKWNLDDGIEHSTIKSYDKYSYFLVGVAEDIAKEVESKKLTEKYADDYEIHIMDSNKDDYYLVRYNDNPLSDTLVAKRKIDNTIQYFKSKPEVSLITFKGEEVYRRD